MKYTEFEKGFWFGWLTMWACAIAIIQLHKHC